MPELRRKAYSDSGSGSGSIGVWSVMKLKFPDAKSSKWKPDVILKHFDVNVEALISSFSMSAFKEPEFYHFHLKANALMSEKETLLRSVLW